MISQVIDGYKVVADLIKVGSEDFDVVPKLLEIRNAAGDIVARWITDFDKLPVDSLDHILEALMG